MAAFDTDTLPPTQELILEVLAARYRLGERTWTFRSDCEKALSALEKLGLIGYKAGTLYKTRLAWLTPLGRDAALDPSYVPPAAPSA